MYRKAVQESFDEPNRREWLVEKNEMKRGDDGWTFVRDYSSFEK